MQHLDRPVDLSSRYVVELLLPPATSFSSGPASAWIACADKVHRVNSQVTAGLRRPVRTHAACISTLIALRPSLGSVRCCDHSCKITFLALGRRLTSGRADDRWTRCSELLVSSRKRSTRQPELSQAGPSDSQRGGRARAHSRQLPVALGLSVQAFRCRPTARDLRKVSLS